MAAPTQQPGWVLWAWLVVLALLTWALPDAPLDPYGAVNAHAIAEFVLIILCISAVARLSVQRLGHRYGLLLTGIVGGFASSTATIYAMGRLAREQPSLQHTAVSAAILSSASTALQLLALTHMLAAPVAPMTRLPIALGVGVLVALGVRAWQRGHDPAALAPAASPAPRGPALLDSKGLLGLTLLVGVISWVSGWLFARYGSASLPVVAAISGLADAHALVPALAALVRQGNLPAGDAVAPIFIALTVNAVSKSLIALQSGGVRFGLAVLAGLALSMAGVWLGVAWGSARLAAQRGVQASCG